MLLVYAGLRYRRVSKPISSSHIEQVSLKAGWSEKRIAFIRHIISPQTKLNTIQNHHARKLERKNDLNVAAPEALDCRKLACMHFSCIVRNSFQK